MDFANVIYSKEELLKIAGEIDISILKEKYNGKISLNTDEIEFAKNISNLRKNDILGDTPFAGDIYESLNEEDKDWLKDLKSRPYSISQLETYAKCPYKYFAERILKLEEIEEPTEEVEALEMGSVLHNIFYEFYKELKDMGIILYGCSENEFKKAQDLLFSIAEKKISEANFKSPLSFYEKEKILGLNNRKEKSILFEFLKQERLNSEGFIPEFLEVGFGKVVDNENLPESIKNLKAKGVLIRGKIDRIDLNSDSNEFKVIDYKLGGRKPASDDLKSGISLQLPLYMYAAKELIKAQLKKDYQEVGAAIYSLKYKDKNFGRLPVKDLSSDKRTTKEIIDICLHSVEKYVELISSGKFHLTQLQDREGKVCGFCGFRSICRIEEIN